MYIIYIYTCIYIFFLFISHAFPLHSHTISKYIIYLHQILRHSASKPSRYSQKSSQEKYPNPWIFSGSLQVFTGFFHQIWSDFHPPEPRNRHGSLPLFISAGRIGLRHVAQALFAGATAVALRAVEKLNLVHLGWEPGLHNRWTPGMWWLELLEWGNWWKSIDGSTWDVWLLKEHVSVNNLLEMCEKRREKMVIHPPLLAPCRWQRRSHRISCLWHLHVGQVSSQKKWKRCHHSKLYQPTYLSTYLPTYLPIYLSISLRISTSCPGASVQLLIQPRPSPGHCPNRQGL